MKLLTFTRLWTARKRIYSINDLRLPTPIDLAQAGLFLVVAVVWVPILAVLGVPFANPWGAIAYIGVPGAIAYVGNKPIFGGSKNLWGYLGSQLSYISQPKIWNGFEPEKYVEGEKILVTTEVWTPRKTDLNEER